MPVFVTPRRGPREDVDLTRRETSTQMGPDDAETTDASEAWPLPKRLRVRLQSSADRFGKENDLDQRLRLAERLQVRVGNAEHVVQSRKTPRVSPRGKAFSRFARRQHRFPSHHLSAHGDRAEALDAVPLTPREAESRAKRPSANARAESRRGFREEHLCFSRVSSMSRQITEIVFPDDSRISNVPRKKPRREKENSPPRATLTVKPRHARPFLLFLRRRTSSSARARKPGRRAIASRAPPRNDADVYTSKNRSWNRS